MTEIVTGRHRLAEFAGVIAGGGFAYGKV